jgi:hypothetical protein
LPYPIPPGSLGAVYVLQRVRDLVKSLGYSAIPAVLGEATYQNWVKGIIMTESSFVVGQQAHTNNDPYSDEILAAANRVAPSLHVKPNSQRVIATSYAWGLMQGMGAYSCSSLPPIFHLTGISQTGMVNAGLFVPLTQNVGDLYQPAIVGLKQAIDNNLILGLSVLQWKCERYNTPFLAIANYHGGTGPAGQAYYDKVANFAGLPASGITVSVSDPNQTSSPGTNSTPATNLTPVTAPCS